MIRSVDLDRDDVDLRVVLMWSTITASVVGLPRAGGRVTSTRTEARGPAALMTAGYASRSSGMAPKGPGAYQAGAAASRKALTRNRPTPGRL